MKKFIIAIIVIAVLIGGYMFLSSKGDVAIPPLTGTSTDTTTLPQATTTVTDKTKTVIGTSAGSRDIVAYHYGNLDTEGVKELIFVGGIHGGYEWNTSLVAYEAMEYFQNDPSVIPSNLKVTVIPVLNPDGLFKVVGTTGPFEKSDVATSNEIVVSGRFNANNVDLNRNFDCDWEEEGKWQDKTVSGGERPFSEPESQAIQNYLENREPAAVVVWYSAAGGVFASSCHNGVLAETKTLTSTFARASGYAAHESFDFYEITGDMVNWLAREEIPAISVLLTNHTDTEWTKNKQGIDALLAYFD